MAFNSAFEGLIATDNLTEHAIGDFQLKAYCEMGHYLTP
jgi:hypothetical protein